MNIDFGTISDVIVQTVCAAKGLRTTSTFSCTSTDIGLLRGLSLTASLAQLTLTLKLFVLVTGGNLLLYGDSRLNLHINRIILESTLYFINQPKRFKKQVDGDSV